MNLPSIPSLASLSALPEMLAGKIPDEMKTMSVTQRHILIVSHAVAPQNVSAQLPAGFELDTLKVGGEPRAIVQTVCCYNDNFHYSPLPKPALDFWQITYRVLTRRAPVDLSAATMPDSDAKVSSVQASTSQASTSQASTSQASTSQASTSQASTAQVPPSSGRDAGAYVWKTFLGTRASWVVQRAVASHSEHADFNVITRGVPERGEYASYIVDAQPSDSSPPTQVAVRTQPSSTQPAPLPVTPFASWDKMVDFLTRRPHAYQQLSVSDSTILLPSQYAAMSPSSAALIPVGGEAREARFGVWEQMGLMTSDEMRRPFSVLIQPELECTIAAPNYFLKGVKTTS